MQSQSLPQETMKEEENTELTLKLQYGYGEETDSFIKPSPRWSSPFSCRTLCGASTTAYHKGQDMVSTPLGGKLEFEKYSGHLLAANCASVKREMSGMDAVSCRTGRDESDDIIRGTPTKKLRLSKYQSSILEASFREHFTLCPKHKSALANKLNLQPRQVEVWFQNRRARTKLKRKEVECENLKRCCKSLREENRRLEREVQALKIVMCAQSPNSLSLSTAHLSMCPSCEGLANENSAAATITSQFKTTPSCLSSEFPYSHSAVC